jgi:catechol 2,3-dioxygenase-like lactoylglutathione lyase family enzyme
MVLGRVVAFVGVADLDRAAEFYGDVLGLRLQHRDDFACVFDAGGATLRVIAVPSVVPAGYTVLGWDVPDIRAEVERLVAHGVTFRRYDGMTQDTLGIWTSPSGAAVAWFGDPDGNTLSLSQDAG